MNLTTVVDHRESDSGESFQTSTVTVVSTLATVVAVSHRSEMYLVPAAFGLIFLLGVIGNVSLIFLLIKYRLTNCPFNIYILNLSLSDLLVILTSVPFFATLYTFESWPYGERICQLSHFSRDVSTSVSALTLAAMSYDRYRITFAKFVVSRSNYFQISKRVISDKKAIVVCIWILSAVFALPLAYFASLLPFTVSGKQVLFCYSYPKNLGLWYPQLVVLTRFLLFYLGPLLVIMCCYISIAMFLLRRSAKENTLSGKPRVKERQRKTQFRAKMILIFAAIFMICFLPNHLFMISFYFTKHEHQAPHELIYDDLWNFWRISAFVFTFLNSCLDPISLYFTSEQLKELFKQYLVQLNCRRKSEHKQHPYTVRLFGLKESGQGSEKSTSL